MDYNQIINYASVLLAVLAVLVFVTNIIVEVIKSAFKNLPTNILAIIVAIVVTMLVLFAVASYLEITIMWYYIVAALIMGLFVAYAAMFGFDKFKDAWEKLKAIRRQDE